MTFQDNLRDASRKTAIKVAEEYNKKLTYLYENAKSSGNAAEIVQNIMQKYLYLQGLYNYKVVKPISQLTNKVANNKDFRMWLDQKLAKTTIFNEDIHALIAGSSASKNVSIGSILGRMHAGIKQKVEEIDMINGVNNVNGFIKSSYDNVMKFINEGSNVGLDGYKNILKGKGFSENPVKVKIEYGDNEIAPDDIKRIDSWLEDCTITKFNPGSTAEENEVMSDMVNKAYALSVIKLNEILNDTAVSEETRKVAREKLKKINKVMDQIGSDGTGKTSDPRYMTFPESDRLKVEDTKKVMLTDADKVYISNTQRLVNLMSDVRNMNCVTSKMNELNASDFGALKQKHRIKKGRHYITKQYRTLSRDFKDAAIQSYRNYNTDIMNLVRSSPDMATAEKRVKQYLAKINYDTLNKMHNKDVAGFVRNVVIENTNKLYFEESFNPNLKKLTNTLSEVGTPMSYFTSGSLKVLSVENNKSTNDFFKMPARELMDKYNLVQLGYYSSSAKTMYAVVSGHDNAARVESAQNMLIDMFTQSNKKLDKAIKDCTDNPDILKTIEMRETIVKYLKGEALPGDLDYLNFKAHEGRYLSSIDGGSKSVVDHFKKTLIGIADIQKHYLKITEGLFPDPDKLDATKKPDHAYKIDTSTIESKKEIMKGNYNAIVLNGIKSEIVASLVDLDSYAGVEPSVLKLLFEDVSGLFKEMTGYIKEGKYLEANMARNEINKHIDFYNTGLAPDGGREKTHAGYIKDIFGYDQKIVAPVIASPTENITIAKLYEARTHILKSLSDLYSDDRMMSSMRASAKSAFNIKAELDVFKDGLGKSPTQADLNKLAAYDEFKNKFNGLMEAFPFDRDKILLEYSNALKASEEYIKVGTESKYASTGESTPSELDVNLVTKKLYDGIKNEAKEAEEYAAKIERIPANKLEMALKHMYSLITFGELEMLSGSRIKRRGPGAVRGTTEGLSKAIETVYADAENKYGKMNVLIWAGPKIDGRDKSDGVKPVPEWYSKFWDAVTPGATGSGSKLVYLEGNSVHKVNLETVGSNNAWNKVIEEANINSQDKKLTNGNTVFMTIEEIKEVDPAYVSFALKYGKEITLKGDVQGHYILIEADTPTMPKTAAKKDNANDVIKELITGNIKHSTPMGGAKEMGMTDQFSTLDPVANYILNNYIKASYPERKAMMQKLIDYKSVVSDPEAWEKALNNILRGGPREEGYSYKILPFGKVSTKDYSLFDYDAVKIRSTSGERIDRPPFMCNIGDQAFCDLINEKLNLDLDNNNHGVKNLNTQASDMEKISEAITNGTLLTKTQIDQGMNYLSEGKNKLVLKYEALDENGNKYTYHVVDYSRTPGIMKGANAFAIVAAIKPDCDGIETSHMGAKVGDQDYDGDYAGYKTIGFIKDGVILEALKTQFTTEEYNSIAMALKGTNTPIEIALINKLNKDAYIKADYYEGQQAPKAEPNFSEDYDEAYPKVVGLTDNALLYFDYANFILHQITEKGGVGAHVHSIQNEINDELFKSDGEQRAKNPVKLNLDNNDLSQDSFVLFKDFKTMNEMEGSFFGSFSKYDISSDDIELKFPAGDRKSFRLVVASTRDNKKYAMLMGNDNGNIGRNVEAIVELDYKNALSITPEQISSAFEGAVRTSWNIHQGLAMAVSNRRATYTDKDGQVREVGLEQAMKNSEALSLHKLRVTDTQGAIRFLRYSGVEVQSNQGLFSYYKNRAKNLFEYQDYLRNMLGLIVASRLTTVSKISVDQNNKLIASNNSIDQSVYSGEAFKASGINETIKDYANESYNSSNIVSKIKNKINNGGFGNMKADEWDILMKLSSKTPVDLNAAMQGLWIMEKNPAIIDKVISQVENSATETEYKKVPPRLSSIYLTLHIFKELSDGIISSTNLAELRVPYEERSKYINSYDNSIMFKDDGHAAVVDLIKFNKAIEKMNHYFGFPYDIADNPTMSRAYLVYNINAETRGINSEPEFYSFAKTYLDDKFPENRKYSGDDVKDLFKRVFQLKLSSQASIGEAGMSKAIIEQLKISDLSAMSNTQRAKLVKSLKNIVSKKENTINVIKFQGEQEVGDNFMSNDQLLTHINKRIADIESRYEALSKSGADYDQTLKLREEYEAIGPLVKVLYELLNKNSKGIFHVYNSGISKGMLFEMKKGDVPQIGDYEIRETTLRKFQATQIDNRISKHMDQDAMYNESKKVYDNC